VGQEVINHDGSAVQHDHKILILTVNSPLSSGSGDVPPLAATSKAGFPDRCFLPLTLVAEVEVTDNPRTTRLARSRPRDGRTEHHSTGPLRGADHTEHQNTDSDESTAVFSWNIGRETKNDVFTELR
jgi:hypothetical protein